MRPVLVFVLLGAVLLASSTPALAVGVDACIGRTCVSFHPLPMLIADLPAIAFDTPLGRVTIIPCV